MQSKKDHLFHPILSFSNDTLVTFLVLDEGKEKMTYTTNRHALLLRSFSTDSRYLKKGYAMNTLLLLNNFVKNQYPHIDEIILAVNQKNIPAQALYLKAGFIDTGKRIKGIKGELMILTKEIN